MSVKEVKVPLIPSDGEEPQFEIMMIRGIPHRREKIRELESSVGGTIVEDELVLANLDHIYHSHLKTHGKPPDLIEDPQTHERFVIVVCNITNKPHGFDGPHIATNIYFKLRDVIAVPNILH